jgi:hypothetical protein
MRVAYLVLGFVAAMSVSKMAHACPPTPTPVATPAVSIAAPAAQAFAQASTAGAVQFVPAPIAAVQQVLVPQTLSTLAVAQPTVAVQSLAVPAVAVLPVAVANSSGRCRTSLLADLRLARQAGRTARKAVLSSRRSGSTAVSQAIAVQRN